MSVKAKKVVTSGFIAGAVAFAVAGAATVAQATDGDNTEKCYGIVKAGQNTCASADGAHSCMGQAAEDGGASEWVAVPAGLCEKLVGGSLAAGEGGAAHSCDAKASCEAMDE